MGSHESSEITDLLRGLKAGDASVVDRLFTAVYQELRNLAGRFFRKEAKGITLQPTALVHEAYLKLVDQSAVDWQGRTHFFAVAAQAMRRILVDHARRRGAAKRGGHKARLSLEEDLVPDLEPTTTSWPWTRRYRSWRRSPRSKPDWWNCGSSAV